jgi:hypothetical protein
MKKQGNTQHRITRAVRKMRDDADTRYFLRAFFSQAGLFSVPPLEPELAARFAGRQQLALEVVETLNSVDPLIFPELLAEDAAEQLDNATQTTYEHETQEPTDV